MIVQIHKAVQTATGLEIEFKFGKEILVRHVQLSELPEPFKGINGVIGKDIDLPDYYFPQK
jgi:hypothetical protein